MLWSAGVQPASQTRNADCTPALPSVLMCIPHLHVRKVSYQVGCVEIAQGGLRQEVKLRLQASANAGHDSLSLRALCPVALLCLAHHQATVRCSSGYQLHGYRLRAICNLQSHQARLLITPAHPRSAASARCRDRPETSARRCPPDSTRQPACSLRRPVVALDSLAV